MTKISVTGAKGQLGQSVQAVSEGFPGFRMLYTDVDELDICTETPVTEYLLREKPDFLINCAAYTAVDKAETEAEKCNAINSLAPAILSNACAKSGTKLLHISTDFVFDGSQNTPYSEEAKTNPLSVYGKSKRLGEKKIENHPHVIIIRTSWLYSEFGSNFFRTIQRLCKEGKDLRVVNDQKGTPTYARDLAIALLTIIKNVTDLKESFEPGIYHYSNGGETTWYDFASEIAKLTECPGKITPVASHEYPVVAERPKYSVLSREKISKTYGVRIKDWKESLRNCIENQQKELINGKS
jgi:dTDP-4-dehydrorhamnose reductase